MIGAVVGPLVSPVVDKVDVDHVVSRIDVDQVLDRVDLDAVLARVDLNMIIDRVDLNTIIDRVDVDRLIQRVDVDQLIQRVDVDQLIQRVDVNQLIQRVDLNVLMSRVDINAIVGEVDVNEVVGRIDTDALVERTEIGALIARSTSGIFATVLDAVRSQVVTLDLVLHALVDRVMRRRSPHDVDDPTVKRTLLPWRRDLALQGTPAGGVSRLVGFLFDAFLLGLLFVFGQRMFSLTLEVLLGHTWVASQHRAVAGVVFVLWAFAYFAVPIAVIGRTPGQGLLGLKVLRVNGERVDGRRASLRTLVMPLSFVLFGLGLLIGLFRADRRTLHDLIAKTSVVYAWDARGAHLRLLAMRQGSDLPPPAGELVTSASNSPPA
jgi:uncharacterized RDD family membrane protein YckC